MMDWLKAILKWLYNWITVLSGVVIGALVYVPPLLDVFSANLQPLLPADKAAWIMALIAIAKGICALIQSRMA